MVNTTAVPFDQRIRIGALRVGAVLLLPLLALTQPAFAEEGLLVELVEFLGISCIITCVLGRLWAILYIGMHKNKGVVTDGPYSMTRNPLYFFSTLGAFGFALLFGKLSLALLMGGMVFAILYITARREQSFLEATFGPDYAAYAARVPMFFPDPRLFQTAPTLLVSTRAIRRSLLDALVFLSAIPLAELAEGLHARVTLLPIFLP